MAFSRTAVGVNAVGYKPGASIVAAVPWILIGMNLVGMAMIARWGLPPEVPWLGREDSDPILGLVGLVIYGSSIGIRVMLTVAG